MIIKFDKPITLEEAREIYNDRVKFVTDTNTYPKVTGVEFNSDPRIIFKRKRVRPKVTKKANKILDKYKEDIESIWDGVFRNLKDSIVNVSKADKIKLTKEQRKKSLKHLDKLKDEVSKEARKRFKEAYKLGRIRGQAVSGQELDDDLSESDEKIIEDRIDENLEYLSAFTGDLKNAIDKVYLEGPFDSYEELESLIETKVEKPKKSRAGMYAMATLGLITAGMVQSLKEAKEEDGEEPTVGGYWTIHPEEGQGGEVCSGCLRNSGKFFTIDEFNKEYQTNDCLTRCRCDLDII